MQFKESLFSKTGAKKLQKMTPYKNVCAQKNLNQTAQGKNAPYSMAVTKKIGTRQLKTEKWHPIRMTVAKKN